LFSTSAGAAIAINHNAPYTIETYLLNGKRAAFVQGKTARVVDLSHSMQARGMYIVRVRQAGRFYTFTHQALR
jgi:hypothetical protein